jgi:hypothetical protein
MRLQHIAVLVLCVSGCADAHRTTVDSGRDAGSLRPRGIELTGTVARDLQGTGPAVVGSKIEGVEVCRDGVRDCVTTNADGWFALGGITPETETLLVYRKDGFWPSLQPVVAPSWSSAIGLSRLYSRDTTRALVEKWNAVLRAAGRAELDASDDSRATILFGAVSSVAGALTDQLHVGLDPGSGEVPLFVMLNGDWVLEVPAGQVALAGVYTNIEPRDDGYELVYEPAHGECRQTSNAVGGWPSASGRPNATLVPARAGHITWMTSEECKFADAGTTGDAGRD